MNKHHYVAIMAGGIGSRFWPMSRTGFPKQFLDILQYRQNIDTGYLRRFAAFIPEENIYVVTSQEYMTIVEKQLPRIKKGKYSGRTFQEKYSALYCLYFS